MIERRNYQVRCFNKTGECISFIFDLTRREAVQLYWESTADRVQMLGNRSVIAQRSE